MITPVNSGRIGLGKYFIDQYGANPNTIGYGQALISHYAPDGWWQYAAFYAPSNALTLARRHRDEDVWDSITLPFGLNYDNSHNAIALGVSTMDGRLHVAAGQHADPVQYTRSYAGFLDDGFEAAWTASSFEPVSPTLAGVPVGDLTYPTFTSTPTGKLLFAYRTGGSGNGVMRLAEYDGTWTLLGDVSSATGNWQAPNSAISPTRNLYWTHPVYDDAGRLHLGGTWREVNPAVLCTPGAPVTNHHMVYVYSDDDGRTWYNTAGTLVGTTGSDPFGVNDPVHIPAATVDTRYAIQVSDLTLGPNGLIGVLPDYVDPSLLANGCVTSMAERFAKAGQHPRWWDPTADEWKAKSVIIGGVYAKTGWPAGRLAATRGKMVFDSSGNMHVIFSGVRICSATAASGFTDWQVTYPGHNYLYCFGEFQIDRSRPGWVSVLYLEQAPAGATSAWMCVKDWTL